MIWYSDIASISICKLLYGNVTFKTYKEGIKYAVSGNEKVQRSDRVVHYVLKHYNP